MALSISDVALNRKFLEMIKLLNIYLNHFPKHEKFALSNRMRNTAYDMFDFITEGQKRYHKKTTLQNLDIKHQQLRMQIYLASELGYFECKDGAKTTETSERLLRITAVLDEVGKLIGAWMKSKDFIWAPSNG